MKRLAPKGVETVIPVPDECKNGTAFIGDRNFLLTSRENEFINNFLNEYSEYIMDKLNGREINLDFSIVKEPTSIYRCVTVEKYLDIHNMEVFFHMPRAHHMKGFLTYGPGICFSDRRAIQETFGDYCAEYRILPGTKILTLGSYLDAMFPRILDELLVDKEMEILSMVDDLKGGTMLTAFDENRYVYDQDQLNGAYKRELERAIFHRFLLRQDISFMKVNNRGFYKGVDNVYVCLVPRPKKILN